MNKKIIWLVVILIVGFVAYKILFPQKYYGGDNGDGNQLDDGVVDDSGGAQARY